MNASSQKFNFISFTQSKGAPIRELKDELKIMHKKKVNKYIIPRVGWAKSLIWGGSATRTSTGSIRRNSRRTRLCFAGRRGITLQ